MPRPRSRALMSRLRWITGGKGARPTYSGSSFKRMWCMAVLPPRGDVHDVGGLQAQIFHSLLGGLDHHRLAVLVLDDLAVLVLLLDQRRMGVGAALFYQAVQPLDDVVAHALQPAGILHVVGDAGHHVFAELALGVHHAHRVHHFHGAHVYQIGGHGGGAHVYAEAVVVLHLARPDLDDLLVVPDRGGDLPFALADDSGQGP